MVGILLDLLEGNRVLHINCSMHLLGPLKTNTLYNTAKHVCSQAFVVVWICLPILIAIASFRKIICNLKVIIFLNVCIWSRIAHRGDAACINTRLQTGLGLIDHEGLFLWSI